MWLVNQCMMYITPEFEHCSIWFIWIAGNEKKCIVFNTTQRRPSTIRKRSKIRPARGPIQFFVVPSSDPAEVRQRRIAQQRQRRVEDGSRGGDAPPPATPQNMLKWCIANDGRPFNWAGFYLNQFLPRPLRYDSCGQSYYCAEEAAAMLKFFGIRGFTDEDDCMPYEQTPDSVYRRMVDVTKASPTKLVITKTQFLQTRRQLSAADASSDAARRRQQQPGDAQASSPSRISADGGVRPTYMRQIDEEVGGDSLGFDLASDATEMDRYVVVREQRDVAGDDDDEDGGGSVAFPLPNGYEFASFDGGGADDGAVDDYDYP
jgi:hypothetical protein